MKSFRNYFEIESEIVSSSRSDFVSRNHSNVGSDSGSDIVSSFRYRIRNRFEIGSNKWNHIWNHFEIGSELVSRNRFDIGSDIGFDIVSLFRDRIHNILAYSISFRDRIRNEISLKNLDSRSKKELLPLGSSISKPNRIRSRNQIREVGSESDVLIGSFTLPLIHTCTIIWNNAHTTSKNKFEAHSCHLTTRFVVEYQIFKTF